MSEDDKLGRVTGGAVPQLPSAWYLYGDRSEYHNAQLYARDQWPQLLVGMRGHAATATEPTHLPPGWIAANPAAARQEYIPIRVEYFNSRTAQRQRALPQMGPVDTTAAQGRALQAALAASLMAAANSGPPGVGGGGGGR